MNRQSIHDITPELRRLVETYGDEFVLLALAHTVENPSLAQRLEQIARASEHRA